MIEMAILLSMLATLVVMFVIVVGVVNTCDIVSLILNYEFEICIYL